MSLPSRGAWIEILGPPSRPALKGGSLPSRGAWIEITREEMATMGVASLPSRGAWIEIHATSAVGGYRFAVAPLTGSVD